MSARNYRTNRAAGEMARGKGAPKSGERRAARGQSGGGNGGSDDAKLEIATDLLTLIRTSARHATDAMQSTFRREKQLGSSERREIAEGVYSVLRQSRLLDRALDEGAKARRATGEGLALSSQQTLTPRERDRARFLLAQVLDGMRTAPDAAKRIGQIDFAAAAAFARALLSAPTDQLKAADLALIASLPDWIAELFFAQFGSDSFALMRAMNTRAPLSIRANTLKVSRDELATKLAHEKIETRVGRRGSSALELVTRTNAFGLNAFRDGLFEVQDEGSQLVAEVVAPPPRSLVIDACAGAGGKTLHLAALLAGKGRVIALDVPPQAGRKLEELRRRSRRAGLTNVETLEVPESGPFPDKLSQLVGRADRVLVDAPCSGVGVLRRNPEARERLSPEAISRLPPLQRSILERYAPLCAVGGRVIYATCTVLREENDAVIESFLANHPEFVRMDLKEILGGERAAEIGDGTFLRLLPHIHDTDGFFAAVLRRIAPT